jgi:hypothetical protein
MLSRSVSMQVANLSQIGTLPRKMNAICVHAPAGG